MLFASVITYLLTEKSSMLLWSDTIQICSCMCDWTMLLPHTYNHTVIPEGRERVYVVALAVETVLLIAAVLFSLFLLLLYCKSKRVS